MILLKTLTVVASMILKGYMVNQVKEENIIIIMDNLKLLILQKNLRF
jgi:uncharacterized lipoprotein YajG